MDIMTRILLCKIM